MSYLIVEVEDIEEATDGVYYESINKISVTKDSYDIFINSQIYKALSDDIIKCGNCGSFYVAGDILYKALDSHIHDKKFDNIYDCFSVVQWKLVNLINATDEEWQGYLTIGTPDLKLFAYNDVGDALKLICDKVFFKVSADCDCNIIFKTIADQ